MFLTPRMLLPGPFPFTMNTLRQFLTSQTPPTEKKKRNSSPELGISTNPFNSHQLTHLLQTLKTSFPNAKTSSHRTPEAHAPAFRRAFRFRLSSTRRMGDAPCPLGAIRATTRTPPSVCRSCSLSKHWWLMEEQRVVFHSIHHIACEYCINIGSLYITGSFLRRRVNNF